METTTTPTTTTATTATANEQNNLTFPDGGLTAGETGETACLALTAGRQANRVGPQCGERRRRRGPSPGNPNPNSIPQHQASELSGKFLRTPQSQVLKNSLKKSS